MLCVSDVVKICLLFTSLGCCVSLDEKRVETKLKEGGDLGVRARVRRG